MKLRKIILRSLALLFLASFSGFFFLWLFLHQDPDLPWAKDHARLPLAKVIGETITIYNVRNNTYQTENLFESKYEKRKYDLSKLEKVWFLVAPFAEWRGPAHTFLSFEFGGDEFLSVSVEARKKAGESYSPFRGLFRYFPLIYVVGDERDLVLLRTNFHKDPVYLYPIKATKEKIRELFLSLMARMNKLRRDPEHYNTFLNSCTTNIVTHVNSLVSEHVPWTYHVFFPGYSDELAHRLGLLDTELSLGEARKKYLITGKAQKLGNVSDFSRQIRNDL